MQIKSIRLREVRPGTIVGWSFGVIKTKKRIFDKVSVELISGKGPSPMIRYKPGDIFNLPGDEIVGIVGVGI
jgi:hypothetical protein